MILKVIRSLLTLGTPTYTKLENRCQGKVSLEWYFRTIDRFSLPWETWFIGGGYQRVKSPPAAPGESPGTGDANEQTDSEHLNGTADGEAGAPGGRTRSVGESQFRRPRRPWTAVD